MKSWQPKIPIYLFYIQEQRKVRPKLLRTNPAYSVIAAVILCYGGHYKMINTDLQVKFLPLRAQKYGNGQVWELWFARTCIICHYKSNCLSSRSYFYSI